MQLPVTGYHCEYGTFHPYNGSFQECNCYRIFGPFHIFRDWLEKVGALYRWPIDITPSLQDQFLIAMNKPLVRDTAFTPRPTITSQDIARRNAWTTAKLQEISKEELKSLRQEVVEAYSIPIAKGLLGKKMIKVLTYVLIRKKYLCPYR